MIASQLMTFADHSHSLIIGWVLTVWQCLEFERARCDIIVDVW